MGVLIATIAGTERHVRVGSLSIREIANGRNQLTCDVLSEDGYRPETDDEIIITDDGTRIFGGLIESATEQAADGQLLQDVFLTHISAVDFNVLPSRRVLNLTIPAGTLKAALQALDDYLVTYGVTLDAAQVDGPTLPELIFSYISLEEALNQIATISGYVWEVDYNKTFRMFLPSAAAAPFNISTSDDPSHVVGDIIVEPSMKDYATRVLVLAGKGIADVLDTLTGDGATQDFTLSYPLIAHQGTLTVGGVSKPVGIYGVDTMEWTYESATNQLHQTGTPVGNGVAILMAYTAQFPALATAIDAAEEAAGHYVEKLVSYPDVFNIGIAQALADALLAMAVTQPRTVRYGTYDAGVHPGQSQTITHTDRNLSGTWTIIEVAARNSAYEQSLFYDVTAVEGGVVTPDWRDAYRQWSGNGGSGATGTASVLSSGSGVTGSGTVGTLAKWSTSASLTDSIVVDAGTKISVMGLTEPWDDLIPNVGYDVNLGSLAKKYLALHAAELWVETLVAQNTIATIGGRVLVGPTTTLAADCTSGSGFITVKHFGALAVGPAQTQNDVLYLESDGKVEFIQPYGSAIVAVNQGAKTFGFNFPGGDKTSLFPAGRIFQVQGSTGNNRYYTSTGVNSYSAPTTTVGVVEAIPSAVADGVHAFWYETDSYTYLLGWRNLDGSGANDWYAGDAVFNTGRTGNGFIDLYSVRGVKASSEYGPTIVGNVRASITYNDWAPRWAIGNLNGLYGYVTNEYGCAFGVPTAAWIKIDPTNGIRIGHNATAKIALDASGNASFTGAISSSTITTSSINAGGVTLDSSGLTIPSGTGSVNKVKFSDGTYVGSNSAIIFVVGTQVDLTGGSATVSVNNNGLISQGGSAALGTSIARWPNAYITNLDVSGTITANGSSGFTGSGSFTAFTFVNGICTSAS